MPRRCEEDGEGEQAGERRLRVVRGRWWRARRPGQMYPAQNIVPLVRSGALDQGGVDALNAVSPALTTERLTELNRRVTEERAVPTDLAKEFVGSLGP